jgi:site-specific recombinase XerD
MLSEEDPKIDALIHILYDMAARIEDVIGLTYSQIKDSLGKGLALPQKKAPQRRLVFLSDDTMERIATLTDENPDAVLFDVDKKLLG